jgi:hypothetical protein
MNRIDEETVGGKRDQKVKKKKCERSDGEN